MSKELVNDDKRTHNKQIINKHSVNSFLLVLVSSCASSSSWRCSAPRCEVWPVSLLHSHVTLLLVRAVLRTHGCSSDALTVCVVCYVVNGSGLSIRTVADAAVGIAYRVDFSSVFLQGDRVPVCGVSDPLAYSLPFVVLPFSHRLFNFEFSCDSAHCARVLCRGISLQRLL